MGTQPRGHVPMFAQHGNNQNIWGVERMKWGSMGADKWDSRPGSHLLQPPTLYLRSV